MKKIRFIMNPISGTSNKDGIPKMIDAKLDHEQFEYEIITTNHTGHASELATKAKDSHVDIIVAVGGDGTINEVTRAIVHSDTALGIIPYGSGNGLARRMLIPMSVKKSIEIINKCVIHDFGYGIINGYPFFCTCGMGFDAYVSQKFAKCGKRGPITYIRKVLEEGLKYKPEAYGIAAENGVSKYKAFLISYANASQYGNNAFIAPQASVSNGLMNVIIMEPFDIIETPRISIDMFNKTLDRNSKIKTFTTKKLHIHRGKPGVIHYDGDPVMTGRDVDVELVEKGIKIIINPGADKSQRQPNAIQSTAAELFNEINVVHEDISKQTRHMQALNEVLQKKLNF